MSESVFTAPGKAVITGEYAVLRGAPAVAMAVNRRAAVTTAPSAGSRYSVKTPGLREGCWSFLVSGNAIEWLNEDGPAIIDSVFSQLECPPDAPLEISIDTHPFIDSGSGCKLGLGSSAAATTALAAALTPPGTDCPRLLTIARAAHSKLQGGKGSGIDVAASCAGGLVIFTPDAGVQRRPAWPDELHYRYFFSGKPASTSAAIARTTSIADTDAALLDLVACARDAATAMGAGNADDAISTIRAYSLALRSFDQAHRVGIFAAGHDAMMQRAVAAGVVYKPCGAGGGDIGIAVDPDPARLDAFTASAVETGFVSLDLRIDNSGVKQESPAGK
jgi:phosphomevalonate kinase